MKKDHYLQLLVLVLTVLLGTSVMARADSEMDQRIESSVNSAYTFKTYLKDDDIKVKSKDGVVILTGTAETEYHRSLAEQTVSGLPGVKSVDNQIQIKGERPAENSDAWIGLKVKAALLFHRNVSVTTQVDVKDGVVTLRGEADNLAQKDLTTEYAQDVDGVKRVVNEMTIAKELKNEDESIREKIDDPSITAQAKMALMAHRSTSGIKTKIETNDGVVVLTGKAKNEAEKDLATKIVRDVKGVKGVVNKMDVE